MIKGVKPENLEFARKYLDDGEEDPNIAKDQNIINIKNSIKESLREQLTFGAYEVLLRNININIIATRIWLDEIMPKIEKLRKEIEELKKDTEDVKNE